MVKQNYFLGLDVGTDSCGYAVTSEDYRLLKHNGEPMWGLTTFEAAKPAAERRMNRTVRRRNDRKKQRVYLTQEIFAKAISTADPKFFKRLQESYLYREESSAPFSLFADSDFTDKDYHKKYPTIHHLIVDLMENDQPHDVRLVYLACSWLISNRGHFLYDIPSDSAAELTNFNIVYRDFCDYIVSNYNCLPWESGVTSEQIKSILTAKIGVGKKAERFKTEIFGGKKPQKTVTPEYPYSVEVLINLLSGKKEKPEDLFQKGLYTEVDSVSLKSDDEDFSKIVGELGEDGELLLKMRSMQDCAMLIETQNGKKTISEAKVAVYEQHQRDLKFLKYFVRKYCKEKYNAVFRDGTANNYVSWSYHVNGCKDAAKVKKAKKEDFYKYLKNLVKDIPVQEKDLSLYQDMLARLDSESFLPKQKDTDNRVIPQQLYHYELSEILKKAEKYLPFLAEKDEDGLSASEKLLSIFSFRIPYFVGPLCSYRSSNAWMVRKANGKILPWNFEEKVDLDASEEAFIKNLTNTCTYLPGEPVLPVRSLLYCRFTVLNEINNLKINGNPIPASVKQKIYTECFMKQRRVTVKQITGVLRSAGLMENSDVLSGIDDSIKSSLYSYHAFRDFLENGILSESQVEDIIQRAAYSEDKHRFCRWLQAEYSMLSEQDIRDISKLNLKEFGRLSRRFLTEVYEANRETGEAISIIDSMWETNENLMQLLSGNHDYSAQIEKIRKDYYLENPQSLNDRLQEMYISPAVRRPIVRTLEICDDVVKAMKQAPEKIFVEMARGGAPDQKGKRTKSRKEQLLERYKQIKNEDSRAMEKELETMGIMADNQLQGDRLFLYCMQLGKDAYTGDPIDISRLYDGTYNIEHIYPRALVKDDSVLNNKVLVNSEVNGSKSDTYPIPKEIRDRMSSTWAYWRKVGLISEEKYARLTRSTKFTEEEKWAFINRQLVETRQSTKAIAELLKERYPNTEIVYVKAGLVSEFRQEYDMVKCREINNLHHAKDAYLNIVVGNVYNEKFSKRWFHIDSDYSLNTDTIFNHPLIRNGKTIWLGTDGIAAVRKVMSKNSAHVTRYAFCRKGQLFDLLPLKASGTLTPLKKGMDPGKYGGYNKATASFFALAKIETEKKDDVVFLPIELQYAEQFTSDLTFANQYAFEVAKKIWSEDIKSVSLVCEHVIKINSVIDIDGLRLAINGKSGGGKQLILSLVSPLVLPTEYEKYVKALTRFMEKRSSNSCILPDEKHDGISKAKNLELFRILREKMQSKFYSLCPGNIAKTLVEGEITFVDLDIVSQVSVLMNILSWFTAVSSGCDTGAIGGSKRAGAKYPTANLNAWKKYHSVRLIDMSASGIFESCSDNLLDLL